MSHSYTVSTAYWDWCYHSHARYYHNCLMRWGVVWPPSFRWINCSYMCYDCIERREQPWHAYPDLEDSLLITPPLLITVKCCVYSQSPYKLLCINLMIKFHEWTHWCESLKPRGWGLNFLPPNGESAVESSHLNHGGPKQMAGEKLNPTLMNHPQCSPYCAITWPTVPSADWVTQPLPGIPCYLSYGMMNLLYT